MRAPSTTRSASGRAPTSGAWSCSVLAIRGSAGVILILFPAFFISLFSSDPSFLLMAVIWVRIQAVGGLFLGGGQVMQQSFNVAGDTLAPLLVTFMSMWVLEIPSALILTNFTPLGVYGIPVAIALAMLARVALYAVYYRTGRWTRAKVL